MRRLGWIGAGIVVGWLGSGCVGAHYRGPVMDVHVHLDPPDEPDSASTGRLADVPTVLRVVDQLPAGSRAGLVTIAPRDDLPQTRLQNDAVLAAVRSHPERFWAIASVNPWDGDLALAELDRLHQAGVKMIKLHPNSQKFDVGGSEIRKVVARTAELGMVILFDGYSPFDANETGKFLMLAIEQPKARMILAHLGGPKFNEMMIFAVARSFAWYPKNVWFNLSAVAHLFARSPYSEQLVFVCRSVGLDRVLFGSDYPVVAPADALEDVRALGFTEAEERRVMHDNAEALLGGAPAGGR